MHVPVNTEIISLKYRIDNLDGHHATRQTYNVFHPKDQSSKKPHHCAWFSANCHIPIPSTDSLRFDAILSCDDCSPMFVIAFSMEGGLFITKTSPCNEHPLTPHFYIVKLGFTRVYIFSYFCSKT